MEKLLNKKVKVPEVKPKRYVQTWYKEDIKKRQKPSLIKRIVNKLKGKK